MASLLDPARVSWAGNEVELMFEGQLLRLDRLVCIADEAQQRISTDQATDVWWVLDYKLDMAPHQQPNYLAQLARYRSAVMAAQPGAIVRAAFVTAAGHLLEPQ
jgi:ATP-dependent helicase/nuclease subunit A